MVMVGTAKDAPKRAQFVSNTVPLQGVGLLRALRAAKKSSETNCIAKIEQDLHLKKIAARWGQR